MRKTPILFILSGLPGTGKTTLARRLAQHYDAMHLRIDTIEQALRDLCRIAVEGEGYRLAYRIAADNLQLGLNVVADSCNPIELTRREWEQVATTNGAIFVNIQVTCTDVETHRRRIESRIPDIEGLQLPTWQAVLDREYDGWLQERIVIDTSRLDVDQCLEILLCGIARILETLEPCGEWESLERGS